MLIIALTLQQFAVLTPNARPHDPAFAPDGALWVTEQEANKMGRLDGSDWHLADVARSNY